MAHFAEIGINNKVLQVIVVSNDVLLDENNIEQESKGSIFCRELLGGTWVQTSYNNSFRKNFAGFGYTYDSTRDAFIPPKPFDSWTLDEDTCRWTPPTPIPNDGEGYLWDESNTTWIKNTEG
jgi:hypothetical protein